MAEKLGLVGAWKRRFGHVGLTAASGFASGAGSAGLVAGGAILETSHVIQSSMLNSALSQLPAIGTLKESMQAGMNALAETLKNNPMVPVLPLALSAVLWGGGFVAGWQGIKHGPESLKYLYTALKVLEPVAWVVAPLGGLITTLLSLGVTAYGMKYRK